MADEKQEEQTDDKPAVSERVQNREAKKEQERVVRLREQMMNHKHGSVDKSLVS